MTDALRYMTGFGGHFESEAIEGALPKGRNSPQRPHSDSTLNSFPEAPLHLPGTKIDAAGCTG